MQHLVVRRTRADIKNIPEYAKAGLHFPEVKGPTPLRYSMSGELTMLFAKTVDIIIAPEEIRKQRKKLITEGKPVPKDATRLGYYRYSVINYFVNKEDTKLYEKRNLTVAGITERLSKLMQIQLIKRLESSFTAFRQSLYNFMQDTQNMIDMLNADTVFICPDIDVNDIIAKNGGLKKATGIIRNKIQAKGGNNREFAASRLKKAELLNDLNNDLRIINELILDWEANSEDPKFDEFKTAVDYMLFNPAINNPSGINKPRLVIFTESKDTLGFLADYIENNTDHRVLDVTSSTRTHHKQAIKENFDANYKGEWKDDYDVIITTEVLAEGVNLHRSNVILNYDTPWNASKLMQRIGRVNRIGSKEDTVHVFNFYPSKEGNNYINLYENALNKLQSFHSMFGEDNKIYSDMEELSEANLHDIVDGELSEWAPFISELKAFVKTHPQRFRFIKEVEPRELGGVFHPHGCSLFLVGSDGRQPMNVIIDAHGKARDVSALTFMSVLKCDEQASFTLPFPQARYNDLWCKAVETYSAVVFRSSRAKDENAKQKKALQGLRNIRVKLKGVEAKNKLSIVDGCVRRKNNAVCNKIIKYGDDICKRRGRFFDLTHDEAFMLLFRCIDDSEQIPYSDPYVMLFEI